MTEKKPEFIKRDITAIAMELTPTYSDKKHLKRL